MAYATRCPEGIQPEAPQRGNLFHCDYARRINRRGATLIEMTIVVAILLLLAALIVPNFVSIKRSRDLFNLEASVARLPVEAKNEARKAQVPVTLRYSDNAIVMEQTPAGGNPVEVKRVDLSNDIQIDSAQRNGQNVAAGSWQWVVYPDGTADTGGIEFAEGQIKKSLVLPVDGSVQWVTGDLPDMSQDKWPAGNLQSRG